MKTWVIIVLVIVVLVVARMVLATIITNNAIKAEKELQLKYGPPPPEQTLMQTLQQQISTGTLNTK